MTTRTITRRLLKPDPGQARAQLEDLASRLAPQDRAAGERLRAVAVELVRRGAEVTVVDYQDPSQELTRDLAGAAGRYVRQDMGDSEHQAVMLTLDRAMASQAGPPRL
jgi:hypothetical protein